MTELKTAFIAGATGYTGREVVRVLAERDDVTAIAHVRPDSSRLEEWRQRFEALGATVDTSPWTAEGMRNALQNHHPAWIYGLLGTTRSRARQDAREGRDSSYDAIDYGLTALLLHEASTLEPKPVFIYLSAANASPGKDSSYATARWKVEQELKQSSVPYIIARPSFISGADREGRPGERIGARVASAALGVVGALGARKLRDRYQTISGADLATALVRVAAEPSQIGCTLYAEELR